MYRKESEGWFKHTDFILIDMICLQIAFYLAYPECNRWNIDTWTDQGRKPGNCQRLYILDIGCTDYIQYRAIQRKCGKM